MVWGAVAAGTSPSMKPSRMMIRRITRAEVATRFDVERVKEMLRLKSCPRCKGDILIDRDHLGWYEQCLQCGYQHDLNVSDEERGYGKKPLTIALDRTKLATGGSR